MSRLLALLVVALGLAGCEVAFDPIAESDFVYAFSGYLDASADTQWVRVEDVAPSTDPNPDLLAVEVTLTDLASGAVTGLTQEVRTFATGPAHLFWTTADVPLGARYRLEARRLADGATTSTTVAIPADGSFTVEVESGRFICPTVVTIQGAGRVADVQARYVVARNGEALDYRFAHVDRLENDGAGTDIGRVYFGEDARRMNLDPLFFPDLLSADIVVAVSTEDWPAPAGLTLEDVLLDIQGEGVENGLGFVGGVVTQRHAFVPGVIGSPFGPPPTPCLP